MLLARRSPDGGPDASRVIRLVETETGRTLARLESPDLCRGWPVFSPDGSRLVVSTPDGSAAHVWDLRTIRRHLVAMGLDWDAPAYSDQDPAAISVPPIEHVEIRDFFLATARGAALAAEGRWEEAAAAYEQAFAHGNTDRPIDSLERAILNLAVGDARGISFDLPADGRRLSWKPRLRVDVLQRMRSSSIPTVRREAPGIADGRARAGSRPTSIPNTSWLWPSTATAGLPRPRLG